jgi:hypothetical protein
MKMHEVETLLAEIQSIDRKPFPDGAAGTWFSILDGIEYTDARQAVHDHYTSFGARDSRGDARPILPVDIRSRAHALAELRERSSRPALPAPKGWQGENGADRRSPQTQAALKWARERAAQAARQHAEREAQMVAA